MIGETRFYSGNGPEVGRKGAPVHLKCTLPKSTAIKKESQGLGQLLGHQHPGQVLASKTVALLPAVLAADQQP